MPLVFAARNWQATRTMRPESYVAAARTTMLLHGGIGFTWEHDAHLYFKNAIGSNALFGDADYQQERLADKLGA